MIGPFFDNQNVGHTRRGGMSTARDGGSSPPGSIPLLQDRDLRKYPASSRIRRTSARSPFRAFRPTCSPRPIVNSAHVSTSSANNVTRQD